MTRKKWKESSDRWEISAKKISHHLEQAFLLRDHPRRRQLEVKCTILIQLRWCPFSRRWSFSSDQLIFSAKTLRNRSQKVERAESAKFFIWFSCKSLKLKSWKFCAMILSPGTIAVALCRRIKVHPSRMEKFASNFYFSSSPSFFITDTRPLQVH